MSKGSPVLVTTQHKGVFFGYAKNTSGNNINLTDARLCVYWSRAMKGFMGLASIGPDSDCRIGPPADIQVRDVTSVTKCTPKAVSRFENQPWG